MAKYNYHELKRKQEIPDDVNTLVEERAGKIFASEGLVKALKEIKTKKLFGLLMYMVNGFCVAEFDFQFGMCSTFRLIGEVGTTYSDFIKKCGKKDELIFFKRSVHKENLDMKNTFKKEAINGR